MKSFYVKVVVVFLTSFILTWVVGASIPWSSMQVYDQPKGTSVFVKEVRLSKPGFVVVQALNPDSKLPDKGGFLNNPTYMPKGIYKNISIYLGNQNTEYQTKVTVTLYEDTNKNGAFDGFFTEDSENPTPSEGFDQTIQSGITGRIIRKLIRLN